VYCDLWSCDACQWPVLAHCFYFNYIENIVMGVTTMNMHVMSATDTCHSPCHFEPAVVAQWSIMQSCHWCVVLMLLLKLPDTPAWQLHSFAMHSRRLSSSVTLPAGGRAGRLASGRSGGRHCTAGQYGYVPLRRHLVLFNNTSKRHEGHWHHNRMI